MDVTPLEVRSALTAFDGRPPVQPLRAAPEAKAAAAYEAAETKVSRIEKYPIDVVAQRVATNLLRIVPGMDPVLAQQIAKTLTAKAEEAEVEPEVSAAPATGTTVDVSA